MTKNKSDGNWEGAATPKEPETMGPMTPITIAEGFSPAVSADRGLMARYVRGENGLPMIDAQVDHSGSFAQASGEGTSLESKSNEA